MKTDYLLVFLVIILSAVGSFFFYNVSLSYSIKLSNDSLYYFKKFLIFNLILPFLFFFLGYSLNWTTLKRISKLLFFFNLFSLILPFIDYFKLPNQSSARWFYFLGLSFQPSEFMKISTLLFLSSILPLIKKDQVYFYISLILIILVSTIIYFQPALSTSLIFLASIVGAMIVANIKFKNIIIFLILISLLIIFAFNWAYRSERILGILLGDVKGVGFQLNQSRLAIGSGGLLGKGWGNSELKLIGLPLMITDNIFAIFAEETGFIGSLILIMIFIFLIFRILYLSYNIKDETRRFFAAGAACWLSSQIFIHLMSNLVISTGVPLPFFSYGPSSQIAIMTTLGIVSKFKD